MFGFESRLPSRDTPPCPARFFFGAHSSVANLCSGIRAHLVVRTGSAASGGTMDARPQLFARLFCTSVFSICTLARQSTPILLTFEACLVRSAAAGCSRRDPDRRSLRSRTLPLTFFVFVGSRWARRSCVRLEPFTRGSFPLALSIVH